MFCLREFKETEFLKIKLELGIFFLYYSIFDSEETFTNVKSILNAKR